MLTPPARAAAESRSTRRTTKPKADRVEFRVSSEEHDLLEEASRLEDRTLTAFVLEAAKRRALDVLADRRSFHLPPDKWAEFTRLLDRAVVAKPRLAASLREPSAFEDEP